LPKSGKGDRLSFDNAVVRRMSNASFQGRTKMPKYLLEGHYSPAGAKGLVHEGGTGRRAAIAKMVEGLGGKLDALYYAFGGVDVYAVIDMPDNLSAAAVALAVNQSGGASVKTVVLMTPEEMDQAGKKTVDYRPPGH